MITQSYYASPRLLRAGLHDYSIEAGAVRENFGLAGNDYGRPLVVGTERYGFSDSLTGEIHAELLERSPSYARLVNAYEEHAAHAEALADELVEETS